MKIYRAVQRNLMTQPFGANFNGFYAQLGMLGHNGIDWSLENGDPVHWDVSIRGTVLSTSIDSSGGIGLNVITEENGEFHKHRFWHLKEILVKPGQTLETGQIMAYGDNTGMSTGSHLHRDLKPMLKDSYGNYIDKLLNNGYFGAIDYMPFLENVFVVDEMERLKKLQYSILERIYLTLKQIICILLKGKK